jgi:uncharacterized protein (TIGR02001 family)
MHLPVPAPMTTLPRGAARHCCLAALAAWAAGTAPAVQAEGWSGGVAAASDKVQRGVSQSDGAASLLADLGYRTDSGWAAGAGVAALAPGSELSLSVSRGWQVDGDWAVQLGAAHYAYRGPHAKRLYDYNELFVGAAWRGRGFATLSVSPDTQGLSAYRELKQGVAVAAEVSWRASLLGPLGWTAGLGYYDLRRVSGAGYAYGSAGLVWQAGQVQAHLTAVASDAASRGLAPATAAGRRWIAAVVWSF